MAAQDAGGQSVRQFCGECGIGEHSFYWWRKRLRDSGQVQFALVETTPAGAAGQTSALELVLNSGEQLRIGKEVDAATLRLVLEAVRG